ncbi:SbtR family transcriptional regulator [Planobispora takensis]|uniref:SbtR family transcriptional regulator n=1 Tax=Planobispora takensis TaxID=1367882 RepID=UPI0035E885E1
MTGVTTDSPACRPRRRGRGSAPRRTRLGAGDLLVGQDLRTADRAPRADARRLLERAQAAGRVRADVDRTDLFALANALSWITDQAPSLEERREHLFALLLDGLAPRRPGDPGAP